MVGLAPTKKIDDCILVKYLIGKTDAIKLINPKTNKAHEVKKGQEFSILQKDYNILNKMGYKFEKVDITR